MLTSKVTFLWFDKIYLQNYKQMSTYMQNNNITGLNISYGDIAAEHLKLL